MDGKSNQGASYSPNESFSLNFVGHFAGQVIFAIQRSLSRPGWSKYDVCAFCDIHLDELSTK